MPQDTSTYDFNFWGTNVPLQCELEAGHYSAPSSYHHAHFPTEDYIVVWDDNGVRVAWDDAVGSIGSAFEVSIDPAYVPDLAAAWTSVPSLGDLDNMGEIAILVNALYNSVETVYEQVQALQAGEWHYIGETGEPAFQNGFSSYDVGLPKAGFRKVGEAIEFAGLFLGDPNTTIFTLPVGFRPDTKNPIAGAVCVDLANSGANNIFDGFVIDTDGTVKSGSNPAGYTVPGWSAMPGLHHPLSPPALGS